MARFPISEPEIVALAQASINGLKTNTDFYPSPPIDPVELSVKLETYLQAREAAITAQAAAQQATAAKNESLQELIDDLKSDLRYAEIAVDYNDAQLKLLGWGGRRERTSLQPPGQSRSLEAPRQGEGWVFLDWKEPTEGGTVAAYKVQSRPRTTETWQESGTAIASEITLVNQPRNTPLEYRVVAINKVGEGQPSNTVAVTL
ncbi:MAG: fibronectin type III domain-containing protein [Chloroflexaceae bacterium]|nr:fibronectin type III domain-containing protein [Chloroflexaceae bacterium]